MNTARPFAPRMTWILLVSLFASLLLPPVARPGEKLPGCWPQEYTVERDEPSGLLTLRTPYYTVQHDLKRGGAIARIHYTHGKAASLLVRPLETWVRDEAGTVFTDLKDAAPRVSHQKDGLTEVVTAECGLVDASGRLSGIQLKTVHEYRWGYIKIRKELTFPDEPVRTSALCPFSAVLAPGLTDHGCREGLTEEEGAPPFSFGSCRWGKVKAPSPSEPALKATWVPRYLVFADPGVEGLEWFAASDLSLWDLQLSGRRGQGQCLIQPSQDPPGLAVSVCPLHLTGTAIPLKGTFAFSYYLGMPILEGHAWKPWFHTSFNRNKGDWVSPEQVRNWANSGMQTVHCHNDGDYYNDGLFWRDGSYPPYPPDDMKKYDQVIRDCHGFGIRVATYFSNKELHPSTQEFQAHGSEWARKDLKGNIQHNFYRTSSEFGAQMCLRSGWLDFLKLSIERVLKNHPLDGVYYDWNVALQCSNPLHGGGKSGKAARATAALPGGTASPAPAVHWDIDELLDLMEWTRRRVGPSGLIIVHNTTTPMFVTENFANHVVAMEWGYQRWSEGAPPLGELPLEWSFVGARSRGVISYGHIPGDAPRRLHRLFALQSLVSGVTPWPASPETFEIYPILKPLGDIEGYRFAGWSHPAVQLEGKSCASAVYSRADESYIIIANMDKDPQEIRCILHPRELPHPLESLASATLLGGGAGGKDAPPSSVDVGALTRGGVKIALPPDVAVLLHVR